MQNAYLGKAYKTRKGEKLIFQRIYEYQECAQLFSETRCLTYDLDGLVSTFRHTVPEDEIIGEWEEEKEEINKEELDRLANSDADVYGLCFAGHSRHCQVNRKEGFYDGFIAGYYKTKKIYGKSI